MAQESAPRPAPRSHFAFTTRRPVAVLMAVMAVCVFGWVSYQRLPLTLMPDISYPTLTVRTEYPGTAPEEVETQISRPLEQELGIVRNLARISSISRAGQSDVVLEFAWDADMRSITQDIREKIDSQRLPQGAERPLLLLYDPSLDPIMRVGFSGPQSLTALRYIADHEIKRSLEAIKGVAAVKVIGGFEEEFQIELDEGKIAILGLSIDQINSRLAQGNVNLPGGNIREGQTDYVIRTLNEFRSIEEIGDLIISQQNTATIRLRDIATVSRSHKERQVITRVNGRESIELEIYKEADANIVAVAEEVKNAIFGRPEQRAYLAGLESAPTPEPVDPRELRLREAQRAADLRRMTDFINHQLPPGASLEILSDQSIFISNSIAEVKSNAVVGGLIAVVILFTFLQNVAHTLIIGITIPVSIVATFAPMYMADVSLNIISLGGLALGVGMLVDNSIVVLESIFRCRQQGDGIAAAAVRGTQEVGSAVIASTLTTVAVFFPIVFVEGVASQIFGDMALTVVFSLLASLLVALYFIPMLASRQFDALASAGAEPRSRFLDLSGPPASPALGLLGRPADSLPARVAGRLVLALASLVAIALKFLLTLAALPLLPFAALFRKERAEGIGAWAEGDRLWRWDATARVWPGLLSFGSLEALRRAVGAYFSRFRGRPSVPCLFRAIGLPVVLAYLLVRFSLQSAFKWIGSTGQLAALTLALLALGIVQMGAAVLRPLVRPLMIGCERGFAWLQNAYPKLLRVALERRLAVIGVAASAFLFCWFALLPRLGSELIPQVHQGEFNLDVSLPVGTPLESTAGVVDAVETEALSHPEVERTATTIGSDLTSGSSANEGEHTGTVTVKLKPGLSAGDEEALIGRLRANLADLPETEIEVSYPALFTFKSPIEVEIRGYDIATLKSLSAEAEERLSAVPGLADVRSTLKSGNPEIQIRYDRDRLAQYGLGLQQVAELVRDKIQGSIPTDFRERERMIDILVRLREPDRLGVDELQRLVVNPGLETPIPLSAVASIQVNEGPSEIRRIDQQRTALITANLRGLDLGTVSREIEAAMQEMDFPAGYHYLVGGQNQEMQTSQRSLALALALALFLVYIVMASQFESLLHPFIIMFTVPLALIGVVLALFILGVPLSILVFIGMIMLAGIVVNNAIVLIDYINLLRREGMEKVEAIVQAGTVRLRPILMTTLTTVLGLLPMALGLGEGAELRAPMAITVIVGLTSSTLLTLVVIPSVYLAVDRKR